jgi:hypothetical protein
MVHHFCESISVLTNQTMQDLNHRDLNELLDMLVQYTHDHSQLIANGATIDRFKESEETLIHIQREIELRKLTGQTSKE